MYFLYPWVAVCVLQILSEWDTHRAVMATACEANSMNLRLEDLDEALISACRSAIGDDLRSITYFTPETFEQLYLRDDLERDAQLDKFVESERLGFSAQQTYGDSELGAYRFTIRAFEHGYVVRVITNHHGVFVTTDSLTMHLFEEVAEAILRVLSMREP